MKHLFVIVLIFSSLLSFDEYDDFDDFDDAMLMEFEDEYDKEVYDPFMGYNRMMTSFNDRFYTYVLNPTTKGYKTVTPSEFRDRTRDFFSNLLYPVRLLNHLLQGNVDGAVIETGRFFVNTTFGVLGFFDAASAQGIEKKDTDFGLTLAHYGVGSGPHIVVPFMGPSNLRDLPSKLVDMQVSPTSTNTQFGYSIADTTQQMLYLKGLELINIYSYQVDAYELSKATNDQYLFLRDMYESNRESQIQRKR